MLQEKVKKPAGKALVAGLMAAWLSTGALAETPEVNDNQLLAGLPQYSVPVVDETHRIPREAGWSAGMGSDSTDGMIVWYSAPASQAELERVQKAASDARDAGLNIVGVLITKEYERIGRNKIVVLANADSLPPVDPSQYTVQAITDYFHEVDAKVLQPSLAEERSKRTLVSAVDVGLN